MKGGAHSNRDFLLLFFLSCQLQTLLKAPDTVNRVRHASKTTLIQSFMDDI